MEEFSRIQRLPPYVFNITGEMKVAARRRGEDIIDFGMGNPDMPTPRHIVDKLIETARDPKSGRYSASKGILGLRRAMAGYYDRRFGVKLDPNTEVIATLGSKEGFANLAQAVTGPGDVIVCPDPAYPIHAYGFIIAGGVIRQAPALSPDYDLSAALRHVNGKMIVFTSKLDTVVLFTGTKLFGTMDGQRIPAAGFSGFVKPPGADGAMYQKVHQYPYQYEWEKYGDYGDHIGAMSQLFADAVIAPLFLDRPTPATQPTVKLDSGGS